MNPQEGEWIRFILLLASTFFIFWFLVIRPQRKEQKNKREMIANLKKGDEVLTIGGVFGRVKFIKQKDVENKEPASVLLELGEGASMRVLLSAIDSVVKPKEPKEPKDNGLQKGVK